MKKQDVDKFIKNNNRKHKIVTYANKGQLIATVMPVDIIYRKCNMYCINYTVMLTNMNFISISIYILFEHVLVIRVISIGCTCKWTLKQ